MRVKEFILFAICMVLAAACGSDDTPDSIEPQLTIGEATDITRSTATLNAHILLKGNTSQPELHFLYGTSTDMQLKTESLAPSDGKVTSQLSDLISNTHYYYCLQSSNGRITLRSGIGEFTTEPGDKPVLSDIELLSKGAVSVILGYSITDDGGEDITETGCYVSEVGGNESRKLTVEPQTAVDGVYMLRISNLKQNTEYEFQAFATNRNGESKGASFKHITSGAITVNKAGGLSGVLSAADLGTTPLCIEGQLNGDDFAYLISLLSDGSTSGSSSSSLYELDLTDVDIVEGGSTYDGEHFTENNTVGTGMFGGCNKLKSLVLPEGVVAVNRNALMGCSSMEQLTIPSSVTNVSPSAGCASLTAINVSPANTCFKGVDGVLYDASGNTIVWYPIGLGGSYNFPATVKTIGEYAFEGYTASNLTLPDNITDIGKSSFTDSKVETITLSAGLTNVASSSFQNCSKLTTVYLGAATNIINSYAFYGCPLTSIHLAAETPPVCSSNIFNSPDGDVYSLCTLYVPKGCKTVYRNHSTWGKFKKIVEEDQ